MYIRDYDPKDNPLPEGYKSRRPHHLRIVSLESLDDAVHWKAPDEFRNGTNAKQKNDREHRNDPRNSWYGCTPAEADERLARGWRDGAEKILDLDLRDMPTPRVIKRTRVWMDEGDDLSLDRLYRGDIDTMWQRMAPRTRVGTLRVTLFAELGINCGVDQKVLFWRGATTLRVADLLQRAGYAVRIVAATSLAHLASKAARDSAGETLDWCAYWTAKQYADPLDIDNLAVSIASAAFFRRQMFMQTDNLPLGQGWQQSWGLGHASVELSDAVAQYLASENGDLLIKVGERVSDTRSANEWLKALAEAMPQIFETA